MSNNRYMLKMTNGHWIKIRKGARYSSTLDDGTEITFQEQPGHQGEPVHTHVWVIPSDPKIAELVTLYLIEEAVYHPHKTQHIALVQGWNRDEPDEINAESEMVIYRKLSESLFNFTIFYLEEIIEAVKGYAAMTNLFGVEA